MGDLIQFCRFIPGLVDRGATVFLECPPSMVQLLKTLPGGAHVVPMPAFTEAGTALPVDHLPFCDFQIPILSLPHRFNCTVHDIPFHNTPYLRTTPELRTRWAQRLTSENGHKRCGLVWKGNARRRNDRFRSIEPNCLELLRDIGGVDWINLQFEQPAPEGLCKVDLSMEVGDFDNTGAIIANLDLVVTVDTSIAHLAGSLGKPVWILLSTAADWRWLTDRNNSIWYSSAQLFRQRNAGDWPETLQRLREALIARYPT